MLVDRRGLVSGALGAIAGNWIGSVMGGPRRTGVGFKLDKPGQGIAFSPSGGRIAVLYRWGDGIGIFTRQGHLLMRIPRRGFLASAEIAFLDEGHVVAPAGDGFGHDAMVQIWSVEDDSPPRTIMGGPSGGGFLFDRAKNIATGGGGRWAAALCDLRDADSLALIDVATQRTRTLALGSLLSRFDRIMSVAAADHLAVGTVGGRLLVLDPDSGRLIRDIEVYPKGAGRPLIGVGTVAFGDAGRLVATGRSLSATVTVEERYGAEAGGADGLKLWSVADGALIRTASHNSGTARQIAWDDKAFIAVFDAGRIVLAAADVSVPIRDETLPGVISLAVDPDGGQIVTLCGTQVRAMAGAN